MAEKERVLGVDYVTLKGRGARLVHNGATCEDDTYVHLGNSSESMTTCGKAIKEFFLTYADVEINCPECVKILVNKKS